MSVVEGHIKQTPKAYHFDFFPDALTVDGITTSGKNIYRRTVKGLGAPYVATQYYPGVPIIFEVDYPDGTMKTWASVYNQDKEREVCVLILGSQQTTKKTIGKHDTDVRKAPSAFIAATVARAVVGVAVGIAALFGSKK